MAKVAVVGAGALGGLLGALLAERGHEVLFLVRSGSAERLARDGLRLEGGAYGPDRVVRVRAASAVPEGWRTDLAVVATKTQDLEAALAQHAPSFGEAPVVALQNGLAQDDMVASAVGPGRAVAAIVSLDASHVEAGVVRCERRGAVTVGPARPEAREAAARAASVLRDAVDVRETDNVPGARWTKLLINLGNVVPAITGLSFQGCARHPGLLRAHVRLAREGLAVARAEGVRLAPLPWTSPRLLSALRVLPEGLACRAYRMRVERVLGDRPAYGSTWQSMERGRTVETDWLNGEVVRRGARHGLHTPSNAAAVALAKLGERLGADEVAAALLSD